MRAGAPGRCFSSFPQHSQNHRPFGVFCYETEKRSDSIMKETPICENHLYAKAYARGRKCVCRRLVVYVLADRKAGVLAKAHRKKSGSTVSG